MKKTFAENSKKLIFLGAAVLVSSAAFLLHNCHKKNNKKSNSGTPDDENSAKVVKTTKKHLEVESHKRIIYLTFDDGPNRGTENLVKIIHERKIPVTTFLVGKHIYGSKKQKQDFEILKKDTLFEIGNHSYTHANNQYSHFYKNPELVEADFQQCEDSLRTRNKLARTPGRNIWRLASVKSTDLKSSSAAADLLEKQQYKIVGWDLEWKPAKDMRLKDNHEKMLKRVDSIFFNDLEKTPRHLVFLTHDQYLADPQSVQELNLFIQKLQASKRFEFRKLSKYPKLNDVLN